jgi:hypothetical protein
MLLKMSFIKLYFGRDVVTDSPSQAVAMAQTEHFIAGGNPDGHAFLLLKKKKKKRIVFHLWIM